MCVPGVSRMGDTNLKELGTEDANAISVWRCSNWETGFEEAGGNETCKREEDQKHRGRGVPVRNATSSTQIQPTINVPSV